MLAVIPARGGSKGVPRKNLRVVDGKPLLCHIADTLHGLRVVVSTEDPEIRSVALCHGYEVVDRPDTLAGDEVTVAEVARHACQVLDYSGPLIVAQPTCPFVTHQTVEALITELDNHPAVTLVAPNPHLLHDPDAVRVNRQEFTNLIEVGVRAFRTPEFLDEYPTGTVQVTGREAIDIDTHADLAHARQVPKRVLFRYIENPQVGTGHRRRVEAIAAELGHHHISINTDEWADLVVNDTLDTTETEIAGFKAQGAKVLTLEDRGPGARLADLVINALYPHGGLPHEVSGPLWADLRPEFVGLPQFKVWQARRVLCLFGGTDPAQLGERVTKLIRPYADVTWVRPGDSVSVAYEMMNHDLLITSAGRTVYEASAVGIPAVVLAQNNREATHVHLGPDHGNIYLGLGRLVTDGQIVHTVNMVLEDQELRRELSQHATVDGKGVMRIAREAERLME